MKKQAKRESFSFPSTHFTNSTLQNRLIPAVIGRNREGINFHSILWQGKQATPLTPAFRFYQASIRCSRAGAYTHYSDFALFAFTTFTLTSRTSPFSRLKSRRYSVKCRRILGISPTFLQTAPREEKKAPRFLLNHTYFSTFTIYHFPPISESFLQNSKRILKHTL